MTIIYHNPRCSKSRQTLALLQDKAIEPEIVLYLDNPPTEEVLRHLISLLSISPRDLLRKGEADYKELGLNDMSLNDDALIKAMVKAPKLIERPIVVHNGKARLGRPPELVLEIL